MSRRMQSKMFRVAVGAEPADRAIMGLRGDLRVSPQVYGGKLSFVVKDPVTLQYFRLQPLEHFLATKLDGVRTARDLLGLVQEQFPESSLTIQDVLQFVGMLQEAHLLQGQGMAHAQWLAAGGSKKRRQRAGQVLMNFMFMKVPLFNPERVLNVMEKVAGRYVFSWVTGVVALLFVVLAGVHLGVHYEKFGHLPYSILSWENLLIFYGVFIVTKVFHEFGHGWTTKHFGGEVSNMGVMLFVFTPSFYCDTTDAWVIASKKARLWINAAGVAVELVLAAAASLVWVYTQGDTLINQVAFNVMLSCSVATVVFNANPLLRYDGYYFLADYLEIPNLMGKGQSLVQYFMQKYVLGMKVTAPADSERWGALMSYFVCSTVYRWMVTFSIVMLVSYFFDRYGMGAIGVMVATAYVLATVLVPLWRGSKYLWKQRWDVSKRLAYIGAAGVAAVGVLVGVALLPWSMTIKEPVVVLSEHDAPIFVRTPGYVGSVEVEVGQQVKAGQVLVRLEDPELVTMLQKAEGQREQHAIGLAQARAMSQMALAAVEQTAVEAYEEQIRLIKQRLEELVLKSPHDGVVARENSLQRLSGNYLATGTKVCRVIETEKLEARITLPQQKAALVKEGMNVRMRLWADAGRVVETQVARLSGDVSEELLHPALASTAKGDVAVTVDSEGKVKAQGKRTTVIMALPREEGRFFADGMTGRGVIMVKRTTVVGHLYRMLLDATTPDWHL